MDVYFVGSVAKFREQRLIPLLFRTPENSLLIFFFRFRSCLKMVNSARADMVGRFFFNVIRIPCFVFSKTEKCTSWTWWGKCIHKEKKRHAVLRQPMSYATNGFFWERNESEISRQKCFHHYFKNHTSHNEIYTVCNPPWIMILCILW